MVYGDLERGKPLYAALSNSLNAMLGIAVANLLFDSYYSWSSDFPRFPIILTSTFPSISCWESSRIDIHTFKKAP